MLATKRQRVDTEVPTAATSAAQKEESHNYECIIFGAVEGTKVESFRKRLQALSNDDVRSCTDYAMHELVYIDAQQVPQVRVRRRYLDGIPTTDPRSKAERWKLVYYGNFHRSQDSEAHVRSIIESEVSQGVDDFLIALGLKLGFETVRKGEIYFASDSIEVELFRLVEPVSFVNYQKEKQENISNLVPGWSTEELSQIQGKLKYLIPKTCDEVELSPLLVTIRSIAANEQDLPSSQSSLRTFARKLGTNLQELHPDLWS